MMTLELPMPVAPKLDDVINVTVTGRVKNIRYDPMSPTGYTIWVEMDLLGVGDGLSPQSNLRTEAFYKRDRFIQQQGVGSIDT